MRCSVTEIDALRYYRASETAELDALLRQLRKQEPPSRAMQAGRALHHILEHAVPGTLETAEHDGFKFRFALDCDLPLPRVRELKGEMEIATAFGPVTLVGVVDGVEQGVRDYKLTSRFDAERYFASYQWRCYLVMFGFQRFDYDVFEGLEDEQAGEYVIHAYHQLPLYAYDAMRSDVERAVEEFARFASQHLPERFAQKEVA